MKKKLVLGLAVVAALGFAGSASADFDDDVTNDNGYVIFGNGGNINGGYTTDRNNGIELGLRGKLRHNATGHPQNIFNSNGDGTYSFDAGVAINPNTGLPYTDNTGVWSYEWSINSDYLEGSGLNLNDLDYTLGLDYDASMGTQFLEFDPINDLNPNPLGDGRWDHSIGTNATGNNAGTEAVSLANYNALIDSNNVAQQSWKAHWYIPGFDPTVDGTYDIFLNAYVKDTDTLLASTSIQIIVGQGGAVVPLPGAAALGLVGLGLVGIRRRFTKTA